MKYNFKLVIYALSIYFLQNIALAKDKDSSKVSVNVSVTKSGISVSLGAVNKSLSSNQEKSDSQQSSSLKNSSNEKSLSNMSDNNSPGESDHFKDIKKINKWKSKQKEKIAKTIKNIKNKGYVSKQDFKKIDNELNKKIKKIAQKINFKFDENNKTPTIEYFNVSESNLAKLEKKAEIIDYIQKTFEVMGIIK